MSKLKAHHTWKDELGVFLIPADPELKMEFKIIDNSFQAMNRLLGGYMTYQLGGLMPELPCGCPLVMVVDEEGFLKNLPPNPRAALLHPHLNGEVGPVGDVFLLGHGLVKHERQTDVDFFGLPAEFNSWEGPGHPIPTNNTAS